MIIELAADSIAVSPVAHLRLAQTPGPPYPVTIYTTESRLKDTLNGVLEELDS